MPCINRDKKTRDRATAFLLVLALVFAQVQQRPAGRGATRVHSCAQQHRVLLQPHTHGTLRADGRAHPRG